MPPKYQGLTCNGAVTRVVPVDPSPWAAFRFGTLIQSGRPMSLHLFLVMSTRFACSVQACGGFSPGSLVFPTT